MSSAAVSTVLVAVLAWLARTIIYERLKAGVQHEFNEKLETIRAEAKQRETLLQAELKAQDTRLQAELRNRDQQLQLLQSGVLSARASRQAALDARRLDAIDALWASFHGLAPLRMAARFMETIKYDAALTHAATDPNTRAFFTDLSRLAGVTTEKLQARAEESPWKARLYVSEQAWKLFEAYQGVLHVLLLRLKQLETGIDKDFTKIEKSIAEVKGALPHYTKFLDQHGADVLPLLIEDLGAAFERELLGMLNNEPRGARDVDEVGILMAAAEKFIASNQKTVSATGQGQSTETNRQP
ncbi:hypothetical protein G8A07_25660 [Roseateles sp. DAIF2]|uniref:hypothetical protein n=1 Tax=Roseateles sp. DAIF2 TaxID=2714952 RepID=UPI0018A2E334|nr:hypothetical protein [Roseateles sp. DAIF2]QPF75972.1 hypothetical protein G8A07_25660 [Roseateles sp. DAIF2]